MNDVIRKALTRKISVKRGRGTQIVEIPPSQRLVYGMYFAIATLCSLTILEATYILVLRSFSSEIFSTICSLIGMVSGVLISQHT